MAWLQPDPSGRSKNKTKVNSFFEWLGLNTSVRPGHVVKKVKELASAIDIEQPNGPQLENLMRVFRLILLDLDSYIDKDEAMRKQNESNAHPTFVDALNEFAWVPVYVDYAVRQLHQYYQDAMTPCSHPAALRFLRLAVPQRFTRCVRSLADECTAKAWSW